MIGYTDCPYCEKETEPMFLGSRVIKLVLLT